MRIAVIGAGASGLPAIKSALEAGCEVICYEKSRDIGGLWRFKPIPCPGEGTVMKTTVINTSKEMTAYSDFPPPKEMANFMHNSQLLNYFRLYAQHFDLLPHIRFGHAVQGIRRTETHAETGQWEVTVFDENTNNTESQVFDGVMVCTGHHTEPHWPKPFEGQSDFAGRIIHSHDYKDHKGFEDKNVVVVGIGNSGADIAVELSKISKKISLVTRSGSWIMNRVGDYGQPADLAYLNRLTFAVRKCIPWSTQNWIMERKMNARFDHGRFGLRPSHRALAAHVTINDELPNRIAAGTVVVRPNIGRFTSTGVVYEDGSVDDNVDVVIFATGFSFGFPLIEEGRLIPVSENKVELYQYMYPPELAPKNTLAVIGLIQPTGSIMPISEMQTRLFMAAIKGECKLPTANKMKKDIDAKKAKNDREFIPSRRHTIQVYYVPYMDGLASLLGCRPRLLSRCITDPTLAYNMVFQGLVPYQYRLDGPHAWSGAREAILSVQQRVFEATRTRRTKETLKATPRSPLGYAIRLLSA